MKTALWIIGILAAIGIAVGLYFVFKKSRVDGGVNGGDAPPAEPTPEQLEETARVKFMADCKSTGLSEVFCAQAWNISDKETSFSQFAATGYGVPGGGCVPFTQQQHNAAVVACIKKYAWQGFIGLAAAQIKNTEACKKLIPPVTSCP